MKKINVSLYGGKSIFGGRETPLEADITYCDKCKQCDFYKNGKCFSAGRWKDDCKFGKKEKICGYTSRAKKYYEFRNTYKNDEFYNKLNEPNQTIGIVDNIIILNINDMIINENGIPEEHVHFGKTPLSYVEIEKFTPELIKKICDLRPKTMFGYEPIRAYYEEYIPKFLDDLKRHYPNIFKEFVYTYPEYDKEINYVGRKAYISTLNDGSELKDCHSNIWVKENDEIVCYKWKTWLPFGNKKTPCETRIKISDDMYCEITDNSQVHENTKFYD